MKRFLKQNMLSPRKLREWWAMRSQRRRRHGAAAPLPVVTLSNGTFAPDIESFDVDFDISVDLKTWPPASLEIWVSVDFLAYFLLDTVDSSTTHYQQFHATGAEATFVYKARYVSVDQVRGFSNELTVNVHV
jgi:hypothetical protein